MNLAHWASVAALTGISMSTTAQQIAPTNQPADIHAPASGAKYESNFITYRPASMATEPSPDTVWHAANKQVQSTGEHAGHVKADAPVSPAPPVAIKPAAAEQKKKGAHDGHH